jgi:hypothetical protein
MTVKQIIYLKIYAHEFLVCSFLLVTFSFDTNALIRILNHIHMIFNLNENRLEQFSILTDPINTNIKYSVTSFILYVYFITLYRKTCLRKKKEEEAYKMLTLIKTTNNAHKISLQSSVSLPRRLRYSYCMIVHIIDDNKKKKNLTRKFFLTIMFYKILKIN